MTKIQRWRPAKGDINKIKMEVSHAGKYVRYADYLVAEARVRDLEEAIADAGMDLVERVPVTGDRSSDGA